MEISITQFFSGLGVLTQTAKPLLVIMPINFYILLIIIYRRILLLSDYSAHKTHASSLVLVTLLLAIKALN